MREKRRTTDALETVPLRGDCNREVPRRRALCVRRSAHRRNDPFISGVRVPTRPIARIGDCHPRVASTKKPPHHSAANDFDVSELFPIKNALSGASSQRIAT
jgi:hypothetical protein